MNSAPATRLAVPLTPELRTAYLQLIEQWCGLRLTPHQARDLDAAIVALIAASGAADANTLYAHMREQTRPDLVEALAARLTVGETHFCRITPQIDALRDLILPDAIARRASERRLRVWSAGCSTGDEVYTLAILVAEALGDVATWRLDIVGTDINPPALDAARQAVYGDWSFRDTPPAVQRRYFTPEGKRWRLVDSIRRLARFAPLNLAADAAAWRAVVGVDLDLIVCRNVTIYFERDAAQTLYQRLAATLLPGGWLVLGPSDPTPELAAGLDWVFAPNAVLWRRPLPEPRAAATPSPPPTTVARGMPATRPPRVPAETRRDALAAPRPPRPLPPARPTTTPAAPRTAASAEPAASRSAAASPDAAQPLEAEAHLQLGVSALTAGATEPAITSLRRATFLAPDSALAHYYLGGAWQRSGDGRRARAALTQARRLLAVLADDTPVAGGPEWKAGDLRQAVETALRALDSPPRFGPGESR